MAIKIVGKDKKEVRETTCGNCASKLEYTLADTKTESRRDYGGGSDTYRYFKCPGCKKRVDVPVY